MTNKTVLINGKKYSKNITEIEIYECELINICPEICHLVNLRYIRLYRNQIKRICPEIGKLVNLQNLRLEGNLITKICPEIGLLVNLQLLSLYRNQIKRICPEIGKLVNLQIIWLYENNLTTICPEIGQLINLQELILSENQITEICPEIGQLVNLQELNLYKNKLTTICPELGNLVNIKTLDMEYNLYEDKYIPPNIERLLYRLKHGLQDNQIVHNDSIQETFKHSVHKLISVEPTITYTNIIDDLIANNSSVTPFIIKFSMDNSIHSELNLTFKEILIAVYGRIIKNKKKKEIIKKMEKEMKSAECKCFTVRITRLVSCLCGFEDDIVIKIKDTDQKSKLVSLMRNKFEDNKQFKEESKKQLLELGYSPEVISEWLDNI